MTLYISDLDGTLLNDSAKLSNTSITLLNKAINNNINFTFLQVLHLFYLS